MCVCVCVCDFGRRGKVRLTWLTHVTMISCRSRDWRSVDRYFLTFPTRTIHSCAKNWKILRSRSRRIWMRSVVVLFQTGLRSYWFCCCCYCCCSVMENQALIIASVADHTALWMFVLSRWSFHAVDVCLILVVLPHCEWLSCLGGPSTVWMFVLSWWSFHCVNVCLVMVVLP